MKSPTIDDAILLAVNAHRGQLDKGDQPYIFHPIRVMMNFKTQDEMIVAILHDVIEDTDYDLGSIEVLGYSSKIIEALDSITKRKGESYSVYCEGTP